MENDSAGEKTPTGGLSEEQAACYSYEGDTYVYTDAGTGFQYVWDKDQNKWTPKSTQGKANEATQENGDETGENSSNGTTSKLTDIPSNYKYNGKTYTYSDEKTGVMYEWDEERKEWKKAEPSGKSRGEDEEVDSDDEDAPAQIRAQDMKGVYDVRDGVRIYTDPTDGTVYEWDEEKRAWFPKLDEEFLARYQLGYGVASEEKTVPREPPPKLDEEKPAVETKAEKKPSQPSWFEIEDVHNTKVYVSNLPLDTTEAEFAELMQKYGLIAKDLDTGKLKIKLYKNEEGNFKGDALCTYIKVESVELALNILDGSDVRGRKIHVERAKFTMKGEYDPSKKPRKRRKKDIEKLKRKQEKLLDWRPDKLRGERGRHENVVILKRLFVPADFDKNPSLLLEYQKDLRELCSKYGRVRKIIIHDRHEEGVAQVFFRTPEEADTCVNLLHGCWFAGRKVAAETWDGVTKYKSNETDAEREARLSQWAKYLEQDEDDNNTAN